MKLDSYQTGPSDWKLAPASSTTGLPPMAHRETPLGELGSEVLDSRFVIVTDDAGRIVGFVRTAEIRERLSTANAQERDRWSRMALSFLLSVTFPADAEILATAVSAGGVETFAGDSDELACIATRRDIYLSWERLSAILAGATSDPLTGLPYRLAFDRRLHEEWSRSIRTGGSIGVILLDLDHFKSTNDLYGHAAGDRVLQETAVRLEESLRSYDLVVRYGGDEFIALCLGCGPGEIELPLRRIMRGMRSASVDVAGASLAISASIGAAVRHAGFRQFEPKDLVLQADRCLYRAKAERDSAVFADLHDDSSIGRIIGPDEAPPLPVRLEAELCGVAGVHQTGATS